MCSVPTRSNYRCGKTAVLTSQSLHASWHFCYNALKDMCQQKNAGRCENPKPTNVTLASTFTAITTLLIGKQKRASVYPTWTKDHRPTGSPTIHEVHFLLTGNNLKWLWKLVRGTEIESSWPSRPRARMCTSENVMNIQFWQKLRYRGTDEGQRGGKNEWPIECQTLCVFVVWSILCLFVPTLVSKRSHHATNCMYITHSTHTLWYSRQHSLQLQG